MHLRHTLPGTSTMTASEHLPVRLVWAPPGDDARLAGAWWPHSSDAVTELQGLLPDAGEHLGGRVTRVSLNMDAWGPDQPRRLRVGGEIVRLGWFHSLDPTTVTFRRGSDAAVTLFVVPPDSDAERANQLLLDVAAAAPEQVR